MLIFYRNSKESGDERGLGKRKRQTEDAEKGTKSKKGKTRKRNAEQKKNPVTILSLPSEVQARGRASRYPYSNQLLSVGANLLLLALGHNAGGAWGMQTVAGDMHRELLAPDLHSTNFNFIIPDKLLLDAKGSILSPKLPHLRTFAADVGRSDGNPEPIL